MSNRRNTTRTSARPMSDAYLSTAGLAARCGVPVEYLARQRAAGEGPRWAKRGGRVWYALSDIEAFEAAANPDAA